jgi:hypothetical protein
MKVAPYDPCMICEKGDSSNCFVIEGEAAEFLKAWVSQRDEFSIDLPENAPDDKVAIRLCRTCAEDVFPNSFNVGDAGSELIH